MSPRLLLAILGLILSALSADAVVAADVEAGRLKVAQLCADCHRPADWNGETQAALQTLIRDVASGKVPHRKKSIHLTEQEIADVAAYWSSSRK